MRKILRFTDLQERGIIPHWPGLADAIKRHGFPEGFMLSPNKRAWFEDEVQAWLETRPKASEAKPAIKGGALKNAQAKRKREAAPSAEA